MKEDLKMRLQLFADGGDGGADGTSTGGEAADAGQEEGQAAQDRAAAYQKFKADYKAELDSDISSIVQNRLRAGNRERKGLSEKLDKLNPIIDELSRRYNVSADDIDGLLDAVQRDRAYIRQIAVEQDKSEEEILAERDKDFMLRTLQAEKDAREEQERQAAANRFWEEGIAKTKELYPDFDFAAEFEENESFKDYLSHGIDVMSAYELAHRDDIRAQLIGLGVQRGQQKTAAAVAANTSRPGENGLNAGAPVSQKVDINALTNEQLDEYMARARRGERIDFVNNF